MKLTIGQVQRKRLESSMIRQEIPIVATRLRRDFPTTFAETSDREMLLFAEASTEQALLLGDLKEAEQAYELAAVNANLPRITADPDGLRYFNAVAGSGTLPGGEKITLLYRNLSRYFEGVPEENR